MTAFSRQEAVIRIGGGGGTNQLGSPLPVKINAPRTYFRLPEKTFAQLELHFVTCLRKKINRRQAWSANCAFKPSTKPPSRPKPLTLTNAQALPNIAKAPSDTLVLEFKA